MKIEELRIGNWVKGIAKESYKIEKITSLKHWDFDGNDGELEIQFSKDNKIYWCYISELKGIPITEEWLLKFGFKKYNELYFIEIPEQELEITVDLRSNIIVQLCNQTGLIDIHNIQYIHQLQNLFYSITQTELQVK